MQKYQQEVLDQMLKISLKHNIPLGKIKEVYSNVFEFMIKEFSEIHHSNSESWDKNIIIKNFGKFVVNKSKLKKYERLSK
jgi:hypothetical protein